MGPHCGLPYYWRLLFMYRACCCEHDVNEAGAITRPGEQVLVERSVAIEQANQLRQRADYEAAQSPDRNG